MANLHHIAALLVATVLGSCGPDCSDSHLQEQAAEVVAENLNADADPSFKWNEVEDFGPNVRLLRGTVSMDGPAGARMNVPTTVRVWCNGSEPSEVTMIYMKDLFTKEFNEAGNDTALANSNRELHEAIQQGKRIMDSLQVASDSSHAQTQRFIDSLERANP